MSQFKVPVTYNAPLSGSVNQAINPWHWIFDWSDVQVGLININLGRSGNPEIEQTILDEVGSYGRQLGRLSDAVDVLLKRLDRDGLNDQDRDAIDAFRGQLLQIRSIKQNFAAGDAEPAPADQADNVTGTIPTGD
jgi:hypothetical protein